MRIRAVDIWVCPLPLPEPLRLGSVVYPTRDFVVLRIGTDEGIDGGAIGYTRLAPVDAAAETLAWTLLDRDPLDRRGINNMLEGAFAPAWAAFARAASLLDIALWDIAARAAQMPLHDLLAAEPSRTSIPLLAVAGYSVRTRGVDAVLDEVRADLAHGYTMLKLILDGADARMDEEMVTRVRDIVPAQCRIAVDAHGSWTEVDAALEVCRRLDGLGLAFIEDPFRPGEWRKTAELAERIQTPLAAGEDLTSVGQYDDLLPSIGALRLDATVTGGVTGALAGIARARSAGCEVLPHVFASLHGQLAAANDEVAAAEVIPAASGTDPIDELLARAPTIADGHLVVDDGPGVGFEIDWLAVERWSNSHRRVAVDAFSVNHTNRGETR